RAGAAAPQGEEDRLEGEQVRKDVQKARKLPTMERRDRGQSRGAADQERHRVLFIGADDEREDGEDGKAQTAHWAETWGQAGDGKGRTSRRKRALEGRLVCPGMKCWQGSGAGNRGGAATAFRSGRLRRRSV